MLDTVHDGTNTASDDALFNNAPFTIWFDYLVCIDTDSPVYE